VLSVEETFILASWRAGGRPLPTSRFAAQITLNVSFVEASAMSAVGQELPLYASRKRSALPGYAIA
jgi:hypothetical protein